jgi:hypothetical protein
VYRKYGFFFFGLNFGLILAIEILKKHIILALSDFSIAFLAIYIKQAQKEAATHKG